MYAVLGNPISHSLSPQIFKLFAAQCHQKIHYHAIQVKPDELAEELQRLYDLGYRGANLTAPLKEKALPLVQSLSESARAAGAVNVLTINPDGSYHGHNSDGAGFIRDLKNKSGAVQGKSILILGAGGAVRGLLPSLLQEQPQQIVIYNRTEAKARQMIADFQQEQTPILFSTWQSLPQYCFDLIIHGTTLGLQGEKLPFPREILNPNASCYDLSYGKSALPFLTWSREQGAVHCHDGLGMLVEQAAEAFHLWRFQEVNTAPILEKIRASAPG
jgi:shikimate dehydrogenase